MTDDNNEQTFETIAIASDQVMAKLKTQLSDKPPALLCFGLDSEKAILDLHSGVMTLGRSLKNDLVIQAHTISRSHFKLTVSEDLETVVVEDLESRNGTLLNDKRIESPVKLSKDDIITAGNLVFKYLPKASPERQLYEQLQFKANTDSLTHCFNKQYLFDVLERELSKQKRGLSSLCIILFDIDHFKEINDLYGHDAGDHVLKSLATLIWHKEIREIDLFSRYGGEEFVILLFRTNLETAFTVAERIRTAVKGHTFEYGDHKIQLSISVGIADTDGSISKPKQLFRQADEALYLSKKRGRNRSSTYQMVKNKE